MDTQVIITTDLGYGDAGKGTMVDALVHKQKADLVVRYSGGAQAAHNVVTPDGRHHTFAQFGSGSFRPGTRTYLGPKMLIQPQFMLAEAAALEEVGVSNPLSLMTIDSKASVITPYHQLTNRLKEMARGTSRHGSTGIGIGETRTESELPHIDHLTAGDLLHPTIVKEKLAAARDRKREEMLPLLQANASNAEIVKTWHEFDSSDLLVDALTLYELVAGQATISDSSILKETLATGTPVIFEAAQGTLLDEDYGFFPFVTRGKVRTIHAFELLESIGYADTPYVLGITRAYAARHGPGAFPTENAWLRSQIHEQHNDHGRWQGDFRMGHFDAVATRYAIAANGQVDGLAVTSVDQLSSMDQFYYADAYQDATGEVYDEMHYARPGNLSDLEQRSAWLMQAVSPLYRQSKMSRDSIINTMEYELDRPVVAISEGMTRNEKTFF